jgi:hypothetical protein
MRFRASEFSQKAGRLSCRENKGQPAQGCRALPVFPVPPRPPSARFASARVYGVKSGSGEVLQIAVEEVFLRKFVRNVETKHIRTSLLQGRKNVTIKTIIMKYALLVYQPREQWDRRDSASNGPFSGRGASALLRIHELAETTPLPKFSTERII